MAKNRPHRHERRRQRVANSYPNVKPSARIGSGDSLAVVHGSYKSELGHRDLKNGIARSDYYNSHTATKTLQNVDSIREIESIPQSASEKALIKRLSSLKNRRAENKTDQLITGSEPYTVRSHQVYWLPSNWSYTTKKYYSFAIIHLLTTE